MGISFDKQMNKTYHFLTLIFFKIVKYINLICYTRTERFLLGFTILLKLFIIQLQMKIETFYLMKVYFLCWLLCFLFLLILHILSNLLDQGRRSTYKWKFQLFKYVCSNFRTTISKGLKFSVGFFASIKIFSDHE